MSKNMKRIPIKKSDQKSVCVNQFIYFLSFFCDRFFFNQSESRKKKRSQKVITKSACVNQFIYFLSFFLTNQNREKKAIAKSDHKKRVCKLPLKSHFA